MFNKLLNYCPKCGNKQLDVEPEPGQYSLFCRHCNFYCEIIIFDEGDLEHSFEEP